MDKLKIMNRALSATGNNMLVTLGKGDDISLKSEVAFDRAIDYLSAFHEWPFTIKSGPLTQISVTGDLPPWQATWQIPPDCWHFRAVIDSESGYPVDSRIVNGRIQTMVGAGIEALYLIQPTESQTWHPAATEVLTLLVEAEIYQGFNEDEGACAAKRGQAENLLTKAAGRVGQQDSPRDMYLSATAVARRRRKV